LLISQSDAHVVALVGAEQLKIRRLSVITRRQVLILSGALGTLKVWPTLAQAESAIDPQPYFANVARSLDALAMLGAPIRAEDAQRIAVLAQGRDSAAIETAESVLDRYTLARLSLHANGSLNVDVGGARRVLVEQGWQMFLVRIANPAGRTENIAFFAGSQWGQGPGRMLSGPSLAQRAYLWDTLNKAPLIEKMWLTSQLYETTQISLFGSAIAAIPLSGIPVEYSVIQVFSRDSGRRSANVGLSIFPKSGGIPSEFNREFKFECLPSRVVTLGILDSDGRGCVASLTIKDKLDHVYPPQAMRLAPDMSFQEHIYRGDGETMRLPDGEYRVESKRGPEYLHGLQNITIGPRNDRIDIKLQRWIDPSKWGWYSGDTHLHAGGCAHYEVPTEGVSPETMIRHVRGEGLSIGNVLTWAPSWYYQKQFFTGHAVSPAATLEHPELQTANNASLQPHVTAKDPESTLRYDVEVSGFPSSHAGHLVLLRLKEQDYPGTRLIEEWPSWNLPILQWARAQGALGGYAHCGLGMVVSSTDLPNYEIPPMDGVGTQEAIIDVTHGLADFLSGCNTNAVAELNAWYHMLNCGFRLAMIGETDYPCAIDNWPGVGRSYVRLEHQPVGDTGYEAWIRGLQQGRLYCGDGRSHFLDFKVNGRLSGDEDLSLKAGGALIIEALVAARLEPELPTDMVAFKQKWQNSWHLENARIGKTREVAVDLVVNGVVIDRTTLLADGAPRSIKFKIPVTRSSWISLRIFPSAHTHPVFVKVGGNPIRASKRSAQWCRACVDKVWEVKSPFMRESERPAAAQAFDHARKIYDAIVAECKV
jgi:hypothetical protein